MEPNTENHHHHIIPTKIAVAVGVTLLFLTAVTVWVAHVDLGRFNFLIAMAVATVKALLVALVFMNLMNDRRENGMIFATSFLFLMIFIVLASTDVFFRGDIYVKGPLMAGGSQMKSKLKFPWVATPELVAKGKELFNVQCVSCHGVEGKGDGPAASALNPKPRNFHVTEGWKNGRRVSMIFKTLKEGLPPSAMASYVTLPTDDRWALAHYVTTISPDAVAKDSAADFAKISIDPTKENGGGASEDPSIPVSLAMNQMMVRETDAEAHAEEFHPGSLGFDGKNPKFASAGGQIYESKCVRCHGIKGQGGLKVHNLGVFPEAFVVTESFKNQSNALKTPEAFNSVIINGIPGNLMPGTGQLSSSEMQELYQFVKSLALD